MVLEAFLFDGLLGDYVAGCEEYLGWALARRILDVSLLSLSFISRRLESWGGEGGRTRAASGCTRYDGREEYVSYRCGDALCEQRRALELCLVPAPLVSRALAASFLSPGFS